MVMIETPPFCSVVRTSAKSRLIAPLIVIISAMARVEVVTTSSAFLKASVIVRSG